jgi:hypothetical protein
MENCLFPELPIPDMGQPGSFDMRIFKVGEPVCLRGQPGNIVTGTYVQPHPQPGTGNVYRHYINSNIPGHGPRERIVEWENVGKILRPVSETAAHVVVRNSPLPMHLASVIKKYGGKRRRTLRKKLSLRSKAAKHNLSLRKKLKNRRRSRRN